MSKLIIISNQVIITEGIKSVLHLQSDIEVVATGGISDIIHLVEEHEPNTLLLQLELTNFYTMDIISTVIDKYPKTKIVIMYEAMEIQPVKDLIQKGVIAFVEQQGSADELINAINSVQNGHSYVSNSVLELVLPAFQKLLKIHGNNSFVQLDIRKPFHLLTAKECVVLQLLADGQSNRSISETMAISEKTVKNHVSSVLLKMEVRDRTQAVIKAIKQGWVQLN